MKYSEGVKSLEFYKVYHYNSLLFFDMVNRSPDRLLPLLFLSLPKCAAAHPFCPKVPSSQPEDAEHQEPHVSTEQ